MDSIISTCENEPAFGQPLPHFSQHESQRVSNVHSISTLNRLETRPRPEVLRPSFAAASESSLRCPPDTDKTCLNLNRMLLDQLGFWFGKILLRSKWINPNHVKKEIFQANLALFHPFPVHFPTNVITSP